MSGPRWLVALDPGSRRLGLAVFEIARGPAGLAFVYGTDNGRADVRGAIAVVRERLDVLGIRLPESSLVSEYPRKYASNRAAWADVDDLRAVVVGVERFGAKSARGRGLWASTKRIAPGVWGHTTPKRIRAARTEARLVEALGGVEALRARGFASFEADPDGTDAAGLGLWALSNLWASGRGAR